MCTPNRRVRWCWRWLQCSVSDAGDLLPRKLVVAAASYCCCPIVACTRDSANSSNVSVDIFYYIRIEQTLFIAAIFSYWCASFKKTTGLRRENAGQWERRPVRTPAWRRCHSLCTSTQEPIDRRSGSRLRRATAAETLTSVRLIEIYKWLGRQVVRLRRKSCQKSTIHRKNKQRNYLY